MTEILGVDVSKYQTPSAAFVQSCQAEGCRFVWIKASEGSHYQNGTMGEHHRLFGQAGFLRGAYHFYNFGATPAANADNFLRMVAGRLWELPPVLDAESGSAGSPTATAAVLIDFLDRVERGMRRTPVVYTYAAWWNANVRQNMLRRLAARVTGSHKGYRAALSRFESHPLWIAQYPRDDMTPPSKLSGPRIPAPWSTWTVWQYTTNHGTLDRNVTTPEALASLTGVPTPVPTPAPDPGELTMDAEAKQAFADLNAKIDGLGKGIVETAGALKVLDSYTRKAFKAVWARTDTLKVKLGIDKWLPGA